jgi:putative oxidoreductase
MIQFLLVLSNWALLAFRVVLGSVLVVHGWPKLKKTKEVLDSFEKAGFKPSSFWVTVAAAIEFVGGIFIILGLFTQIISFLAFLQFLVILIVVKRNARFKGEVEFDLLILAGLAILVTMGGGALSVDESLNFLIY